MTIIPKPIQSQDDIAPTKTADSADNLRMSKPSTIVPVAYFKIFSIFLACFICLPILIGGFIMRADPKLLDLYDVLLNYRTSIKNEYNDVVFIGDSSCLMGVNPNVIEGQLNKKVVNLGTYGGSGIVGYDIILRTYLENNPKPKLIVFYISACIPNFYIQTTFEQVYAYTRYGSNPRTFVECWGEFNPLQIHSTLITYVLEKLRPPETQQKLMKIAGEQIKTKGYWNDPSTESTLKDDTTFQSRYKYGDYFDTSFDPRQKIKSFMKSFESYKVPIIVFLAPMPKGELSYDYFKEIYKGMIANEPTVMENKYFTDYTHMTHEGATLNSKKVADFLEVMLKKYR